MSLRILFLVFFTMSCMGVNGQDDWGSWNTVQVKKMITDKWHLRAKPILRTFDNFSKYSDTSIDVAIGYKFSKNFSFEVMQRRFFLKDQGDREFFFLDSKFSHALGEKFQLKNTIRIHIATDLNRRDPDFIRWLPTLHYPLGNKQKVFAGFDFFFRVTDEQQLAGNRWMLGYDRKLGSGYGLNIQYWYQNGYSDLPIATSHLIVWTLSKTFGPSKKEE